MHVDGSISFNYEGKDQSHGLKGKKASASHISVTPDTYVNPKTLTHLPHPSGEGRKPALPLIRSCMHFGLTMETVKDAK